jgi:hypothetical protein
MLVKTHHSYNKGSHTNKVEDFMDKNSKNYRKKELKISGIEMTSDRLTGRAGLAFFVAYLHRINIFPIFDRFLVRSERVEKALRSLKLSSRFCVLWSIVPVDI